MWILLSIVLFVLGILVLSLRGFFGTFPDNWQWVGIVLAGVGIAMGVPSIFQMILGRPVLVASFHRGVLGNKRTLQILLRNVPIGQKSFWHKLGVQRDTIQSLEVSLRTFEAGSQAIVQPIIKAQIYDDSDSTMKNRVILPPTLPPGVSLFIADWDEQNSGAFLRGDLVREPLQLKPGLYRIELALYINGESKHIFRDFVVGKTADELMWVLPNPDREDYRIL